MSRIFSLTSQCQGVARSVGGKGSRGGHGREEPGSGRPIAPAGVACPIPARPPFPLARADRSPRHGFETASACASLRQFAPVRPHRRAPAQAARWSAQTVPGSPDQGRVGRFSTSFSGVEKRFGVVTTRDCKGVATRMVVIFPHLARDPPSGFSSISHQFRRV
jgi:hypothetical protein